MNHDEIWDDSALIESWNDALAEYKKYHSIHAKGGSVKDLLAASGQSQPDAKHETTDDDQPMDESEIEQPDKMSADSQSKGIEGDARQGEESLDDGGAAAKAQAAMAGLQASGGSAMPGPQMVLGNIQDEGLKKLLMSWYYAGYYTGLYEGQQQAKQQSQA
ncbi:hypothetical protein DL546_003861 [Coniochaeta pulveracea]|uniref:Survival Motor Neuron Gemin2-binding domain-containing protein n=1 Tax=Coniochaeta pulveracea TaxID=177199 RepID=A0A420YGD3_9PEZI|nr:hypothetical protein DL546_003861 [Coniochaeta pulveracea]